MSQQVRYPKLPVAGTLRAGHPLANGLELYVPFAEGGRQAFDYAARKPWVLSNDLIRLGRGADGNALVLPAGANGYAHSGAYTYDARLTGAITAFARTTATTTGTRKFLVKYGTPFSHSYPLQFGINTGGYQLARANAGAYRDWNAGTVTVNQVRNVGWSCPTLCQTPPDCYVDGSKVVVSANVGSSLNGTAASNTGRFAIGGDDVNGASYFQGSIDLVAVWSRGLADWEHQWLSDSPYDVIKPRNFNYFFGLDFSLQARPTGVASVTAILASVLPLGSTANGQSSIVGEWSVVGYKDMASVLSGQASMQPDSVYSAISSAFRTYVTSPSDDGQIRFSTSSSVALSIITSGYLRATNEHAVYCRFQDVVIPRMAYVRDARLLLTAANTNEVVNSASIYAYKQDYSWIPSSYGDFIARPKTQALYQLIPTLAEDEVFNSVNLTPIVRELIDSVQVRSPTALCFFLDSRATGASTVSFKYNGLPFVGAVPTTAPSLFIEFGAYTWIQSLQATCTASCYGELRLNPILAGSPTGRSQMDGIFALGSAITGNATGISTFANVNVGSMTLASSFTATGRTEVSSFVVQRTLQMYGGATVTSDVVVVRTVVIERSVTRDYSDVANFVLSVSGDTLDVSK